MFSYNFSPVTQLQNLSRDVSSPRNHKKYRGHRTEHNSHRASGGRTWRHKPWHIVHWPIFTSQDTLLKFNECTYGANIYNSKFSAAALCSRHCCPHLHFLSQFFPFNTSHLPFLDIQRIYHWASCWPVAIATTSKILFSGLKDGYTRSRGVAPRYKIKKMGVQWAQKLKKWAKVPG